MKIFFKTLRAILGPILLLWEFITRPKGISRPLAVQAEVDQQCQNIVLYQYKTCPFCIKVRQEMRRLSLNIERLDASPKGTSFGAQQEGKNRAELVRGGGKAKVPCLKITDQAGMSQWMYESGEIITYLRHRFASA